VTAAIEDDLPSPSSKEKAREKSIAFELGKGGMVAEDDDWLQYDDEVDDDDSMTEVLIDVLLRHAVPEDVMDQVISTASVMGLEEPSVAFVGALDELFQFYAASDRAL
jgi:hypothetical protein